MNDMKRSPELIDRLVNYVKRMQHNKKITIKSLGAFKECKNFYAQLDLSSAFKYLVVKCHNINNYNDASGCTLYMERVNDDLKKSVIECLDILDNITFSVADGVFQKKGAKKLHGTEFQELMNELWGLEEEIDCCVCKEKTTTETPCGHKLCILCWSTINDTKPRCPMCREKIDYREAEEPLDSEED